MILDSQEMVRDYETHSKKVNDREVADLFKKFAEECGYQAAELQKYWKTSFKSLLLRCLINDDYKLIL